MMLTTTLFEQRLSASAYRTSCAAFDVSMNHFLKLKVFVEAVLRDPASGNKLLAEGEGLFYMKRPPKTPLPPSPPPRSPHPPSIRIAATTAVGGSLPPAPGGSPRVEAQDERRPSSAGGEGRSPLPPVTATPLPTPGASAGGTRGGVTQWPRISPPPSPPKTAAAAASKVATPGTTAGMLSYDEAIQEFGPGNPDAVANILAFYGRSVTMLRRQRPRPKL